MDAIRAVGLLGGLGGKSRKGFGSLVLRELLAGGTAEWEAPKTTDELKQEIQNLYRRHDAASPGLAQLPLYTALSARARHVLIADGQSEPFILLDRIGRELMRYRSWGNRGRVLNEPREGNFKDDHDLMKALASERKTHPRRIVFGLPHNYSNRDSSNKVRRDQQVLPDEFPLDRRASPLLIHIHECGNRPVAVLSFLPAQFLPTKGGSSKMNVGGAHVELVRDPDLWNPIEQFLARLLDPSLRKEPFTDGLEIVPS
jgi:CRISPR-associated protein Cmr1